MSDSAELNYFVWLCDEIAARLQAGPPDPFPVELIRGLLDEANQRSCKFWSVPVAEVHETLAGCWIRIVVPGGAEIQHPLWTLERVQSDEAKATTGGDEGQPQEAPNSPVLRARASESIAAARRDLLDALRCWSQHAGRFRTEPPSAADTDDTGEEPNPPELNDERRS